MRHKQGHLWRVVPLSKGQLLDVREEDILGDGLYRKCMTYRGGGGYDQFPDIAAYRLGGYSREYANQFVVQLRGCNLDCHYCYVTRAGVWGQATQVSTSELVDAFVESGQQVFHLMGGAPALQLPFWGELIEALFKRVPNAVFHSDLMLTERSYINHDLRSIIGDRCLYAIDIKGLMPQDWLTNTRKSMAELRFWQNWRNLQEHKVPAYVTFTGVSSERVDDFWALAATHDIDPLVWRRDSFVIDLIEYKATPHVDEVPWGSP